MPIDKYKSSRRGVMPNPKPKCACGVRFVNGPDGLCDNCRKFKSRTEARETRAAKKEK